MFIDRPPTAVLQAATTTKSGGIVQGNANNVPPGVQQPTTIGAAGTYFTVPFRIEGPYMMIFLGFVKGGTLTSVELNMEIFGSGAQLQERPLFTEISDHTAPSANQVAPFIIGTSYLLNQSNLSAVTWTSGVFSANAIVAIPVMAGAAPGAPLPFVGKFARLLVKTVGVADAGMVLSVEVGFSDF